MGLYLTLFGLAAFVYSSSLPQPWAILGMVAAVFLIFRPDSTYL